MGTIIDGTEIPREIRRHQWSALNGPLLWATAEDTRYTPVLVWLSELAQGIPNVNVAGVEMGGREALTAGWEALRDVMRSMGIQSREQLAEWIHNQGFPMPRWGAYISGRVQERILNIAITQDARVSAIESVYVMVTMAACDHRQEPVPPIPRAARPNINNDFPVSCWEALDGINLQEVFESRLDVLQSCPHSVRGRFRQAVLGKLGRLSSHDQDKKS